MAEELTPAPVQAPPDMAPQNPAPVASQQQPQIIIPGHGRTQRRLDGKRPQLQSYTSPGYTMIPWFYMYELPDGTKHIMRLMGVENRSLVLQHAEQMHPGETVELHPQKDDDEIFEAIKKLAEDPSWYPVNEQTLNEINNAATMGIPHPSNEPPVKS